MQFFDGTSLVAKISSNKSLMIAANRVTTQTFDLLLNLGTSYDAVISILKRKEVVLKCNGIALYNILGANIPINFTFEVNVAKTFIDVGFDSLKGINL